MLVKRRKAGPLLRDSPRTATGVKNDLRPVLIKAAEDRNSPAVLGVSDAVISLVTGTCPRCGRGVRNLLVGSGDSGQVDRLELAPLLAALGAAAAFMVLLYATRQGGE
ncbi:MAG TPA: hypothetical protein VME46_02410 [Acidimicrobiales bacterium]|nr:hypothetical protein [Acidimicrobiales bacterium]